MTTASFGEISLEMDARGAEVVLTGEIDMAAVRQASDAIEGILCAPPSRLDIDASGVTFIDGMPLSWPEPPFVVEQPCALQGLPSTNGDGLPFESSIWLPPAAGGR